MPSRHHDMCDGATIDAQREDERREKDDDQSADHGLPPNAQRITRRWNMTPDTKPAAYAASHGLAANSSQRVMPWPSRCEAASDVGSSARPCQAWLVPCGP